MYFIDDNSTTLDFYNIYTRKYQIDSLIKFCLVSLQDIKKLFEELKFDKAKVRNLKMKTRQDDEYLYHKARGTISFGSDPARDFEQVIIIY